MHRNGLWRIFPSSKNTSIVGLDYGYNACLEGHIQTGKVETAKKAYKYKYNLSDDTVTVYELKPFPGIHVGTSPSENEEA